MITIKTLFISVFMLLKTADQIPDDSLVNCDLMTAKATVTNEDGKGFKVEIEVKEGTAPFKYLFYKEAGNLISEDFDSSSVGSLAIGKYYCTVADKKGCRKTVEFEIK